MSDDLAALRRSAGFVQASPDPAIVLTPEGVIIDWNPAAERLYGYPAQEALGAPLQMLVPPELQDATSALLSRASAGEAVSQVETQRIAKDGRRIDVSISLAPVRDSRGAIIGVAGFTRDITLRTLVEERLRKSEAQLAEAEQIAGLGSWEWDVISDQVPWSANLYRIFGVDSATFTPTCETYFTLVHPEDRAQMQVLAKAALEDAAPMLLTHRVVRPDGAERITELRSRSIVDDAGDVVRLVGTVQDVTDAVQARQRPDRASRGNEAALNCAGDGLCGLSLDGTVTFANPAALRLMGQDIEEMRGRDLHATFQHTRSDGTPYAAQDSPILASLRDGAVHRCDRDVFWRRDGTCFAVEYTSTPLLEHGAITGAVVVFRDISDRRAVERAMDELTSVVSHELRTPLASIRGSLGLLESGALSASPEKARRMIEIAVQNTDRVVRLINDILDVDHLSSGSATLSAGSCDAAQLVRHAAAGLTTTAEAANVTLVTRTQPSAVLADADRIIQTLTNLIANAIKFSEPGMIVAVGVQARDGDVLFEVSDEGPGVPPHKIDAIFERFEQVDASDSREKGGSGLGLTICRAIVELHGGRIWAQSPAGAGATFSFTLPASPVPRK
ncbi:MAG: PAS domain S-box protein [Solirubrobacteraceae bacterium]|nr:PAS domain S-box protein [Solirubrobacteraceae bacterium]